MKTKGMKVYVLFIEQVSWTEVIRQTTDVFSTLEKARKAFKSFTDDERQDCERYGWTIDEQEDFFEAYQYGDYAENHTNAEIREEIIK